LADRVARTAGRLPAFGSFMLDALQQRIRARAQAEGGAGMRRWIEAWEQVRENFERASGLNLEPRQTILSSARAIGLASKRR
jgi:hypothetical protein